MKIRLFIFCFICIVIFTNCSKIQGYGPSSVSGQAIDQTTGKGVPYATISLLGQNSNIVGAGGTQASQTITADGNGNFSFSFNYQEGNDYSAYAEAPNYLNDGNAFTELSAGKNNDVKIKMAPEGWVRFHLIPVGKGDEIYGYGGIDGGYDFYYPKDTFTIVNGFGNMNNYFLYKIFKGSTFQSHFDTLFVKEFDTINATIKY